MNIRDNHHFAKPDLAYSLRRRFTMAEPTEKEPRGPINLRIKFRSANLDQFIERYAVDVSRGGIFIRTREPLPVGTRLKLEFQLLDATPLLAGEGTVVWIRGPDPMRVSVTPGMGVRFDKLTPESQPTLEKILAEKTPLQQAGVAHTGLAKSGGGMAVRRPSSVFPAVDPAGSPKAEAPAAPTGASEPAPTSTAPRPSSPFVSVSKTSFLASRTSTPAAPASTTGPFGARTTTNSGVRPAPVPSALFEPPTADDIDKALEALHETTGSHDAPQPAAAGVQATPAVAPAPAAPQFVADAPSNEPTRVVDVVDELVGGSGPRATGIAAPEPLPKTGASAAALDAPLASHLDEVEPGQPLPAEREPRVDKPVPIAKLGDIAHPIAPEKSRRFRAASRAYPTLQRRKIGLSVAIVVIGALAIVGVLKLHWKERLFPTSAAPGPAPVVEAPPPVAPVPAAANAAPPPAVAPAPEGAGGGAEAKAGVAAPSASPPPKGEGPAVAKAAPAIAPQPVSEKAAPGTDAHASKKHAAIHRRPHEAPEGAGQAGASGSAPTAGDEKAGDEKASDEKASDDKAATDKNAAPSPTGAAPPAPPPPILKISSTPAGAEVLIDGTSVGSTPFTSKTIDPASPHAITVRKDGYEPTERMIGGLDWSRPHGNGAPELKVNVKLRRAATPAAAPTAPKENAAPADDSGGPYIKEIKPDSP
jgi:uncharacterized protein (TIGR02266 family)